MISNIQILLLCVALIMLLYPIGAIIGMIQEYRERLRVRRIMK